MKNYSLSPQVKHLEVSLAEKGQAQREQKQTLQRDIEKLSGTVQIATKFNMANDNAIRRLQEALELYKAFTAGIESRLGRVSSGVRPRADREETSLEGLRLQFDTTRHLEHLQLVLDRLLGELDDLRRLRRQHEALTAAAQLVSQQLAPPDASVPLHGDADDGSRLRQAYAAFVLRSEERVTRLREEAEFLNRFVRGCVPEAEVPGELRDLEMVPRSQKEALQLRVEELEKELAARAEVKRRGSEARDRSNSVRSTAPAAPAPSPANRRSQPEVRSPPGPTGIPFAYHSKKTQRDPKPKLETRTGNGKVLSTRVVNF